MRRPCIAVVADDPVGDEVSSAGRNVEHRYLDAEVVNRGNAQVRVTLQSPTLDVALAGNRRINRLKELQVFFQPAAHAYTCGGIPAAKGRSLDDGIETKPHKRGSCLFNHCGIGVAHPKDAARVASFRIEDPRQKTLGPIKGRLIGPGDQLFNQGDLSASRRADRLHTRIADRRFLERERARLNLFLCEISLAAGEALVVDEGQPELVQFVLSPATEIGVVTDLSVSANHSAEVSAPIVLVLLWPSGKAADAQHLVIACQMSAVSPPCILDVLPSSSGEEA